MAEIAAALGEQPAAGRVVHVDPVAVGEREEDVAQRIAGAGLLADAVGERLGMDRAPVDRRRIELGVVVPALEDLEAGGRQRVGIAAQHRQVFLARDRLRHRPVGIGLEAAHDRLDLRRRILGRADDHQALEGGLAVVDEDHRIVAGIDHHVALAEILRQPAPALEVGDDLLDALVDRGVERQRRLGADDAVDRQALGLLVGLHHAGQRLVVEIGHRARLGNRRGRARPGACAAAARAGRSCRA